MMLATKTLIVVVTSLVKLVTFMSMEIKSNLFLLNFFKLTICITFNMAPPLTNTLLISLPFIKALIYRGFKFIKASIYSGFKC